MTATFPDGGQPCRLGRVERSILEALDDAGGFLQREALVDVLYPRLRAQPEGRGARRTKKAHMERTAAEATVSRAIASLERKGLVLREHNHRTGRTFVRSTRHRVLPEWEQIARAEEDLAAHCMQLAKQWMALARRSHGRAGAVRRSRSVDATESERLADLAEIDSLQSDAGSSQ